MTDKNFRSEFSEEFKQMARQHGYDFSLEGRRIRLSHTNDKYTDLKAGDMGTIRFMHWNYDCFVLDVSWDSGSRLGLIVGKDTYEVLD